MAVFTQVSENELKAFLMSYDIGDLISYEGIEQGVSNTNYFIDTTKGRFVLTLFEPRRVLEEDVPFFIHYALSLEKDGAPRTMIQKNGEPIGRLCDRPTAIYALLEGSGGHVSMLDPGLCEQAGATLAKMHLTALKSARTAQNRFGLLRWHEWSVNLGPDMDRIKPGLRSLTQSELAYVSDKWPHLLPVGAIHGDYFPDNVFFKNGRLVGVIDFHFACTDLLAYDLAIACNAWSFDEKNEYRADRMQSLLKGYESIRPLSQGEKDALPLLLRAAALRFLLSRIEEKLNWREGDFMKPHDPLVFEKRLRHFQS